MTTAVKCITPPGDYVDSVFVQVLSRVSSCVTLKHL